MKRSAAWDYLIREATNEQLRTFVRVPLPKRAKRTHILDALPLDLRHSKTLISTVSQWKQANDTNRHVLAVDRSVKAKPILEAQHIRKCSWYLLGKTLQIGDVIDILCKPCVFYEWAWEKSNPGPSLIRYYESEKTKCTKVKVLSMHLPSASKKPPSKKRAQDYWSGMYIQVELLHNVTLESLSPPPLPPCALDRGQWETWMLSKGDRFFLHVATSLFLDKIWNHDGFAFQTKVNQQRATLLWNADTWYMTMQCKTHLYDNLDLVAIVISYAV